MDGWLVVDKPAGPTSHDVVARARRALNCKKIGHTGTLDPSATGVTVLAVGKTTRLIAFLEGHKTYQAIIRFGATTDTLDATGQVLDTFPTDHLALDAILEALLDFQGTIQQVPPMVSAVHHDGKRLYELARQGQTVERQPRTVMIDQLRMVEWSPPLLTLEVGCSAGTYIRTLADDLGRALGSGAHLASLRRTEAHGFELKDAISLDQLDANRLLPMDHPLLVWPRLDLDPESALLYRMGQLVPCHLDGLCRVYVDAQFIGMGKAQDGQLHAKVNLSPVTEKPIPAS